MAEPKKVPDYTDDFERFWKIYPKRNGRKQGKRPAFKIWTGMTKDQQRAAYTDVDKRNRARVWDYVKDAQRYLKDYGWEDEWEPPQQDFLDRPPEPKEEELKLSWGEILLGRLWIAYIFHKISPVDDDGEAALKVKREFLREEVAAYDEDVRDGTISVAEACRELAPIFLRKLDAAYGRNQADSALQFASRQRWETHYGKQVA